MAPAASHPRSPLSPETATPEEMKALLQSLSLQHIAIIMDGNRRWAREKHLPSTAGHFHGVKALKALVRYCGNIGLDTLTVYAFSTENWSRTGEEVGYLMKLFAQSLLDELSNLDEAGVRLKFMGDLAQLPPDLQPILQRAMEQTQGNTGLCLQVATNYGSRAELTQACQVVAQQVANGNLAPQDITESHIEAALYTQESPTLDLVIRTGGEFRLSNFLLWQSAYAEFYSTDTLWPDFNTVALNRAILEFSNRQRRFGQ